MKLDFNNIDEVFKDGLENFTEQPSGGIWDKISRKMLWHDILHLRFGNFPRLWLGSFAAVVVLSVLISFWIISGDGNATLTEPGVEQITSNDNLISDDVAQQDPDLRIISNTNNNQQVVSQAEADPSKIETGDLPAVTQPNQIVEGEGKIRPDDASTRIINNAEESKADVSSDAEKSQAATVAQNATQVENEHRSGAIEEAGVNVAAAALNAPKQASGVEPANDVKQPQAATSAEASGISETAPPETQTPSINTSNTSAFKSPDNVSGMRGSTADLNTFIDVNQSLGDMQKLNNLSSISFTTADPVPYGQRPAERNFVNPPAFLNRAYQPYFSIKAYYAPELTEYHRVASESRENSWLAGVSVNYNTEKYTIQAGLEYSRFDDLGDYMVNINSYDSIGFYEGISGFDIDPQNPGELIYHTHTVEVWDTVQQHSHQQTKNNYTYLQIPVLFGYKAMERGIFSAHIKAGPSFSFLLNRVEPTLSYQSGAGTRITGVDNFTASRINTNVQVLVSVALRMHISERMGILVEPTYRYYLNSVYDMDEQTLKNPYGIGVRGGIFFNFK